jgi:hypothetical protein
MGDSELVTKHNPFHIIRPDATTVRKLSAWKSSWSVSYRPQTRGVELTPCRPSLRNLAISDENMADRKAKGVAQ